LCLLEPEKLKDADGDTINESRRRGKEGAIKVEEAMERKIDSFNLIIFILSTR
jgi:hypothetical protein